MSAGDLLFYRGDGSLFDQLIQWRTRGPFTHVEVDVGGGQSIGALSAGVTRHVISTGRRTPDVAPTSVKCLPDRLPMALDWLAQQVKQPYGWWDIADDGLSLALPHGPFVVVSRHYDCSDLSARFLWVAGYPLPADLIDAPQLVSPNSLARALGILK